MKTETWLWDSFVVTCIPILDGPLTLNTHPGVLQCHMNWWHNCCEWIVNFSVQLLRPKARFSRNQRKRNTNIEPLFLNLRKCHSKISFSHQNHFDILRLCFQLFSQHVLWSHYCSCNILRWASQLAHFISNYSLLSACILPCGQLNETSCISQKKLKKIAHLHYSIKPNRKL